MDVVAQAKWDRAAATMDIMSGYGLEKRWEPFKRENLRSAAYPHKRGRKRLLRS